MSKHHPTGLFHQKPSKKAKDLLKLMRSLGMTDEQIKIELTKIANEQKQKVGK